MPPDEQCTQVQRIQRRCLGCKQVRFLQAFTKGFHNLEQAQISLTEATLCATTPNRKAFKL